MVMSVPAEAASSCLIHFGFAPTGIHFRRRRLTLSLDLCLPNGQKKILVEDLLVRVKTDSVQELILHEDDGIGVPDGGFEQSLAVFSVVGADHFQAGAVSVPGGKTLRVLRCHSGRAPIRPPEHDGNVDYAARHVERFRRRVDHLGSKIRNKEMGTGQMKHVKASIARNVI